MARPMDTTRSFSSAIEIVDLDLDLLTRGIIMLREELADARHANAHFMLEGLDLLVERAAGALAEAWAAAKAQGVK